ncbi:universal stress protein [Chryseobacterium sp. 22532]|uniref:universal stress protein n=1 Tax=Chryseobacterium sp. 22532 TaxID=3453938 RepID=UPI003F83DF72
MIVEATALAGEYQINVEYHLASGSFFEEAQKSITDNEIDLVVMGMGVKSFDQSLLGNTTTKAIHRFKPILVIFP